MANIESQKKRIVRAERSPLDPAWVEELFNEINLLVLDDAPAPLARRVCELARARSRSTQSDQPLAH